MTKRRAAGAGVVVPATERPRMTAETACALVRRNLKPDQTPELRAVEVVGHPQYWYVTAVREGKPTVGGVAWLVHHPTREISAVPASRPPQVNCRIVTERNRQRR